MAEQYSELIGVVERLFSRSNNDVIREGDICNAVPEIAPVFSSRIN